jgi:transposase-like protein
MQYKYPDEFKKQMVKKLSVPGAISASRLAKEVDVPPSTLSRWKREAATLEPMATKDENHKPQESTNSRRPQDWRPEEIIQVLAETTTMSDEELGEYLRRKGLHEATLKQWRASMASALGKPQLKAKKSLELKEAEKQIRKLEREIKRKDAALAETAALLVLKKKVQEIWGDEDDDTNGRNG